MDGALLRRWLPVVAVILLLGAAMFAAVYANPVIATDPLSRVRVTELPGLVTPPTGEVAPTTQDPGTPDSYAVPTWLSWAITALCGLAVAIVIALLVWSALRDLTARRIQFAGDRGGAQTLQETRQLVRGAVDDGLADLDDDTDPRRAIIACWVRLERAAGVAGVPRGPGDTATDLVRRLLGTHLVVSAPVLDGLAGAYLEARFTEHVLGPDIREQARAALRQLRAELDHAVAIGAYDRTGEDG